MTDKRAAIARAKHLGYSVTIEQWQQVEMALKPSGISGDLWLTDMLNMVFAATLTFEDTAHSDIDLIWRQISRPEGRSRISAQSQPHDQQFPRQLRFKIQVEIDASNDDCYVATPVSAHVLFERVGARLYGWATWFV